MLNEAGQKALDSRLRPLSESFSGVVGISLRHQKTGLAYSFHGGRVFSAASTAKLFVLGALLEQVDKKELKLEERLTLTTVDRMTGSGILKELDEGLSLTLKDLATLMIIKSDNTATNMLLDRMGGPDRVNVHLEAAGLTKSRVNRKISGDPLVVRGSEFAHAAPDEMTDYLARMKKGMLVKKPSSDLFYGILKKQQYLDFFPRYLPLKGDPGGVEPSIEIANKTGFMDGIRADCGYLAVNNELLSYAVMANGCKDKGFTVDNEGSLLLAKIGRIIYEVLCP